VRRVEDDHHRHHTAIGGPPASQVNNQKQHVACHGSSCTRRLGGMVRLAAAVLFGVGAVVFGVLFLLVFATKLTSGQWPGYFAMVLLGVGCAACFVAARRPRISERQDV
jgi:hypothetical protein